MHVWLSNNRPCAPVDSLSCLAASTAASHSHCLARLTVTGSPRPLPRSAAARAPTTYPPRATPVSPSVIPPWRPRRYLSLTEPLPRPPCLSRSRAPRPPRLTTRLRRRRRPRHLHMADDAVAGAAGRPCARPAPPATSRRQQHVDDGAGCDDHRQHDVIMLRRTRSGRAAVAQPPGAPRGRPPGAAGDAPAVAGAAAALQGGRQVQAPHPPGGRRPHAGSTAGEAGEG